MTDINILIVDDESMMRNLIRIHLSKQVGFKITEAANGKEALKEIKKRPYNLVILDVMMPEMNGWDVCKEIRKDYSNIAILMLTARTDTMDKVKGLDIGADDYLTKPFKPEELVARVKALLRRTTTFKDEKKNKTQIQLKDFTLDVKEHVAFVKDKLVHLTPKEFELLKFLLSNPKQVFKRDQLLIKIWGIDFLGDERTVDTHIKSIRQKLKKEGLGYNLIETVWGVGYKTKGIDTDEI
ncbi:MAG: response regulator transcription factor [Bacillaceae bacterium]|nr:response regulator transcription factor [Bacillaceae bacterium]